MDDPVIRVEHFPMSDTGLGREVGYEDDVAMVAAAKARRAELPEDVRRALDEIDRALARAAVLGQDP